MSTWGTEPSPWGQAPQQPQQPAGGYPAAPPPPGAGQPWAQPTPGGYGQAYQPPTVYSAPPAPARPRSPMLGMISLAVILIATAIGGYGMWLWTNVMMGIAPNSTQSEITESMRWPMTIVNAAMSVGFGAWVAAIVATATNRGRVTGIVATILGVLAPLGLWVYFVSSMIAGSAPH